MADVAGPKFPVCPLDPTPAYALIIRGKKFSVVGLNVGTIVVGILVGAKIGASVLVELYITRTLRLSLKKSEPPASPQKNHTPLI